MARNGSGTMTVTNTFVAGNPITASGHNQNNSDFANEITNSVAADGQTTITGPIKFANGTAAAPALTYASDTDTGFYRAAANSIGLALEGSANVVFGTATAQFNRAVRIEGQTVIGGELITSATATFNGPVAISGTATFSKGFISSATANFLTGFIASASANFGNEVFFSATATFKSGFIASATATFTNGLVVASGGVSFPSSSVANAALVIPNAKTLLATLTASNSATLSDTSSFAGSYSAFELEFANLLPATNNVTLELQVHIASGYQATNYLNKYNVDGTNGSSGTTFISLTNPTELGNSGTGYSALIRVHNPAQSSAPKTWYGVGSYVTGGGALRNILLAGMWNGGNNALDGFQVLASSGNLTSGTIKIYGIV